ncbi:MAG: N-acetyl-gamma-glutamyl-phosphate reductase [Thermoplasmata archaeon]|nr:N-acetyl-gamma-glutamyl-phosphate reductase [Thermoplasmata archaeon]
MARVLVISSPEMATAAVLGASGYLGGELLRVLSNHPDIEVTHAISRSHAGARLGAVAPQLERFGDLILTTDADGFDGDLAFLAQPSGEAMGSVPSLLERGIRVIDLGADYRLKDPSAYARAYGRPHSDLDHLAEAVYGLPELFRDEIRRARLVANPGCYPTATLLAVAPLVRLGEIRGPVVVDAKSGTSGAGATPTPSSHHPEAAGTILPYGTPSHRHVPEMEAILARMGGTAPSLVFVPHLVPLVRGLWCSIYPTPAEGRDPSRWTELLSRAYGDSPFVRVGEIPRLPWASGTNRCYLSVQSAGGAPVLFSALDNLGKGGATQAVQNANLLLGLDERTGLTASGFGI